ncbi:MAG: hypothetical protein ABSB26_08520 [Nitrososphaerales archaeon]
MMQRVLLTRTEYRQWRLNPRWKKFLEIHFNEVVDAVEGCGKRWACYSDVNGHLVRRVLKCRKRQLCPSCANQYRKFLTDDAISEIGKVYNKLRMTVKFASGEFTFNPHISETVSEADFPRLRQMAIRVVNDAFSEGGRYQLAGEVSVHFWSSSAPFSGWQPHIHWTLFDLVLDKVSNRFVRIPLHLTGERLHALRMAWRDAVNSEFGTNYEEIDIHYRYSKGLGHLRHRLEYSFRTATIDFYKTVLNAVVPVDADPAWIQRALLRTDKSKRVVWFGWLQDRNRGKAFSIIDLEWKRKAERDKERKKVICPLCGEEMHLVSVWDTWEDFADVDVPCILGYRESGGGLRG